MPTVHNFVPQPPGAPGQQAFIQFFTTLMTQLEGCWTNGFSIGTAIDTMFSLQSAGTDLIQAGFTPQFTFHRWLTALRRGRPAAVRTAQPQLPLGARTFRMRAPGGSAAVRRQDSDESRSVSSS
jgi:hypothetical protein